MNTDLVPYTLYGRVFQCRVFAGQDEANAFMLENDEWGLLAEEEDGTAYLARMEDGGAPAPK